MKKLVLSLCILSIAGVYAENVCFNSKDPGVKFAAKDMARCLSIVTGKKWNCGNISGKKGDIVLVTDRKLRSQEWRFTSKDGKLFIAGKDEVGIVYGVYAFLEKYAGCFWPAPDTEIAKPIKNWRLPVVNEKARPVILRREMYVGTDYMESTWRLRNKENRRAAFNMNINIGKPHDCHTFDTYAPALRKIRPDLFKQAVSGGKCYTLCMTDPEVQRLVAEQMIKFIEADRKAYAQRPSYMVPLIYDLSQMDGGSSAECWCDSCRKLAIAEGSYSGPNITFANAVLRLVRKKYPEIMIRTFAYSYTMKPPKTVKADDGIIIHYCASSIYKPLVPNTSNGKEFEEWGKFAKYKAIWSYWRTYNGSLYPFVRNRADIAAEFRFCRDQGVIHYFAENEAPLSRSFAMMQHWLMLKMLEDPDRDIFALSRKFAEGYYGKGAPAMLKYLDYLEKRHETTRAFLDVEFFNKVNKWLDEAERLAAGDKRSLLHIKWERVIVDRSMYQVLNDLLKKGYKFEKDKVLKRFAANSVEIIQKWSGLNRKLKPPRILKAKQEAELFSAFPVEIPKRFDGCDVVDLHWNALVAGGKAQFVKDPDAVCGTAFKNRVIKHQIPFVMGIYFSPTKRGQNLHFTPADIPQDEKFHLYKIGNELITRPLYIYYDYSWTFRTYLPHIGIIPEKRDVWISIKFTGPMYVKGSKAENAILFDRVLLVKDPNPMGKYKKVDPGKNLLPNKGFEHVRGGWATGWRRGSNKLITLDSKVKRNGKYSVKLSNVPKYSSLSRSLGRVENLKTDLLIRGWYKQEKIENLRGHKLPFIGIWCNDIKGRNSYTMPVVSLFPSSRDWTYFETVVELEDLKKRMARHRNAPHTWSFRVMLYNQPGTLWVDDLEIIPLERKK